MSEEIPAEASWSDEEIEQALISFIGLLAVLLVSLVFLSRLILPSGRNNQNQREQERYTLNQNTDQGSRDIRQSRQALNSSCRVEKAEGLNPFTEIDDTEYRVIGTRLLSQLCKMHNQQKSIAKGSMIAVSINPDDCNAGEVAKVLRALSCMCSVIVILSTPDTPDFLNKSANNRSQTNLLIKKFRDAGLSQNYIADHRFLACQSLIGRVAIIRQLGNAKVVSLVLDYDKDIESQLSRFGFNVIVYGDASIPSLNDLLSIVD